MNIIISEFNILEKLFCAYYFFLYFYSLKVIILTTKKIIKNKEVEIVDLTYIREMSGDNQKIIKEMITIFLEQIPEFLDEMNSCHSNKDWHNLGMIAHKAKSSVAIMGMEKQSNDLKTLELLAKEEKDTEKYLQIIQTFEEDCKKAVEELRLITNT